MPSPLINQPLWHNAPPQLCPQANASAPTLLFHGQHDPRMPLSQPFQLHYALQALKVKSRFLVFPGAGHIPGDPNQIARMWDESLEWVAEHMPTQLQ